MSEAQSEEEIKIVDDSEGEEEAYVEYDIASYPSDYTIDVLYQMKSRGDIVIPDYQRKYVWKIEQASLLARIIHQGDDLGLADVA